MRHFRSRRGVAQFFLPERKDAGIRIGAIDVGNALAFRRKTSGFILRKSAASFRSSVFIVPQAQIKPVWLLMWTPHRIGAMQCPIFDPILHYKGYIEIIYLTETINTLISIIIMRLISVMFFLFQLLYRLFFHCLAIAAWWGGGINDKYSWPWAKPPSLWACHVKAAVDCLIRPVL